MNIWRVVQREVRSAWRSMRYDLRRPADPGRRTTKPAGEHTARSARERAARRTGAHTAASARTAKLPPVDAGKDHPAYDAYARRTRRVRTAVVVATLAVGGAAVTYFGVVGGLAALLADETGVPGALPGVSAEVTPGEQHAGGLDGGKAARPALEAPSMVPPSPAVPDSGTPSETTRPIRTVRPPRRTSVPRPPVPTPAPHPTPTCSETPVPSPSTSASPNPSGEPSPPPVPPE